MSRRCLTRRYKARELYDARTDPQQRANVHVEQFERTLCLRSLLELEFSRPPLSAPTRVATRPRSDTHSCHALTDRPTDATGPGGSAPPRILAHPQDHDATGGDAVTLEVTAAGTGVMTFQWYRGQSGTTTEPIANATRATYTTPSLTATTTYWVRLADAGGATDSETATVRITRPGTRGTSPVITTQPADQILSTGRFTLLKVRARGTRPLRYQWYVGASGDTTTPIRGATAADYPTPSLTATTPYWARVSNSFGRADSESARVAVSGADPDPTPDPHRSLTRHPTPTQTPTQSELRRHSSNR